MLRDERRAATRTELDFSGADGIQIYLKNGGVLVEVQQDMSVGENGIQ